MSTSHDPGKYAYQHDGQAFSSDGIHDDPRSLPFISATQSPAIEPSIRIREWLARINEVEAWVEAVGLLPVNRPGAPGARLAEAALSDWLSYQRSRNLFGLLTDYERARLEALRGFRWAPWDEAWEARLLAFDEFLRMHKRVPRYRSSAASERALASWLAHQRGLHRQGRLEEERATELAYLERRVARMRLRERGNSPTS